MNALAYVIAVLNPLLLNTKDVEVRLGPIHTLADEIRSFHLPPEAFKFSSYYRNEHKGIYLSKNLWNFMYLGKGDRNEEGTILKLDFQPKKLIPPNQSDPLAYLLHPHDFSDEDLRKVDQYIQNMHKNRNMRSIHKLLS